MQTFYLKHNDKVIFKIEGSITFYENNYDSARIEGNLYSLSNLEILKIVGLMEKSILDNDVL